MEGLAYDYNIEEDPDDDKDKKTEKKKRHLAILEAIQESEEEKKEEDSSPDPHEEAVREEAEQNDVAPELDAEAPLEHLSRVEREAIAQVIASERLARIRNGSQELSNESLAAESLLENIEASGDVNQAYNDTLTEIGEAAITAEDYPTEPETAVPLSSEDLVEAAKRELKPSGIFNSNSESLQTGSSTSTTERIETGHIGNVYEGIVDYVVGRRYGRLTSDANKDIIENRLAQEVNELHLELTGLENHVRELAYNRKMKRKELTRKPKVETIGKALVDPESLQHDSNKKRELAGISAHTMNHDQLVSTASDILIDGKSLKQVYDSHLVGEKGLRRVVAEYMRGGDFRKSLSQELIEREKDFERDPVLRDQGNVSNSTNKNTKLDSLLKTTGIDLDKETRTIPRSETKSSNLANLVRKTKPSPSSFRQVADIIMMSVIAAMAITIIILIFIR